MDISIRPIRPSEQYFLKEMLYEAIYNPGQKLSKAVVDQPEFAKYIKDWGRPNDLALIAIIDQEMVGAIWCRQLTASSPGYGYIDDTTPELGMAVKSAFRDRGIGSGLLKKLVKLATSNGLKALSLSVDKRNPAIRLYRRAGFITYKEEETAFTMKMNID